jgi:hypothetical protein
VETFSADWLALREPADHHARATTLVERCADAVRAAGAGTPPLHVIDLGSGSGSNLRYLAPRLPVPQRWHLLDHDAALLDAAGRHVPAGVEVEFHRVDLRRWPDERVGALVPTLVAGAALLDLVSPAWLERLAEWCRSRRAVALFALSYDGRIVCDPVDPFDASVRDLVNRHQRTDKGFGPAAGPDATATLARCLAGHGHTVHVASSDWHLGHESGELQRQLVGGWADAAAQLAPKRADAIAAWRERRLGWVSSGSSRLVVGHQDLLAYPAPAAPARDTGAAA